LFFDKNISAHVNRQKSAILFFVRVNQVLVRLWARRQVSAFRCRGSEVSDHRYREPASGRRSG
jgi:hypothetical protein